MSDQDDREAFLRERIRAGMWVLGMDGGELGRVFSIGTHMLAFERGAFLPREWKASFSEVDHVDERGVWLRHGSASAERTSDAFAGPAEPYRAAAEASPIHQWTGFDPPATAQGQGISETFDGPFKAQDAHARASADEGARVAAVSDDPHTDDPH